MKLTSLFIIIIALGVLIFSLVVLFNYYDYENEGILGIGIGMLIGYIGIIKNTPDIYEIETLGVDTKIDLNGTQIILSKFNEISDTVDKIFPVQKPTNLLGQMQYDSCNQNCTGECKCKSNCKSNCNMHLNETNPSKPVSIIKSLNTRNKIRTVSLPKMKQQNDSPGGIPVVKYNNTIMELLKSISHNKLNDSIVKKTSDKDVNGNRQIVNLFEKIEPVMTTKMPDIEILSSKVLKPLPEITSPLPEITTLNSKIATSRPEVATLPVEVATPPVEVVTHPVEDASPIPKVVTPSLDFFDSNASSNNTISKILSSQNTKMVDSLLN